MDKTAEDLRKEASQLGKQAIALTMKYHGDTCDDPSRLPPTEEARKLHEQAVELIERAIHIEPDYADDHYLLFWNLRCLGEHEIGLDACRRALEVDPNHEKARGVIAYEIKVEAARLSNEGYKRHQESKTLPEGSGSRLSIDAEAMVLHQQAIESINAAIEIEPGNADSYYMLAWNLKYLGDTKKAQDACQKALDNDPDHEKTKRGLARLYDAEARRLCSEAKALTSKAGMKHITFASRAKALHEEAVEVINRAIDLLPCDSSMYHTLYRNLAPLHKYEEALTACQKALEIDPEYTPGRRGLAYSHMRLQNYSDAVSEYRELLNLGVRDPRVWLDMGYCMHTADHCDERISHFEAAIEEHPEDRRIVQELSLSYAMDGRLEDALPLAEKVVALGGGRTLYIAMRIYSLTRRLSLKGRRPRGH